MNLNRDEVSKAVHAGLVLLSPDSDVEVPAKLVEGLYHLKGMLKAIGDGTYALIPTMQMKKPPKPPTEGEEIGSDDDD